MANLNPSSAKAGTAATPSKPPSDMDILDRKLLNIIQSGFPLMDEPYAHIGEQLGIDEASVLERLARLQRRAAAARAGMREFLTAAALQSETDRYDERADRVTLMSLHAAKGLEFPVVFIVGCEEGLLPYRPPHRAADPVDPAEERRLFYVGMTRARHRLILTHASRRLLFGQRLENRISRFVTDIETALREAGQAPRRPHQAKPEDLQLPLF